MIIEVFIVDKVGRLLEEFGNVLFKYFIYEKCCIEVFVVRKILFVVN